MSISLRQAREPALCQSWPRTHRLNLFTCAYEISAKELIEYLHNISAVECETRFQRREKRENASTIISTWSFRSVTRANSNDCFSPGGGNKPCCAQQRRRDDDRDGQQHGEQRAAIGLSRSITVRICKPVTRLCVPANV